MRLIVKDVAEARGIKNAKQLADACKIHLKTAYKLWGGDAQLISMDVLGRLCTTLRVQPGILFEQIADTEPLPSPETSAKSESKQTKKRTAKG